MGCGSSVASILQAVVAVAVDIVQPVFLNLRLQYGVLSEHIDGLEPLIYVLGAYAALVHLVAFAPAHRREH